MVTISRAEARMVNIFPVKWLEPVSGYYIEAVSFDEGHPTSYAVRHPGGMCLNKKNRWEFEPMPSNRTKAFINRCRWTDYEAAAAALNLAYENQ